MFRIKLAVLTAATIATASMGLAIPALASTTVTVTSAPAVTGGPISGTTVSVSNNRGADVEFSSSVLEVAPGSDCSSRCVVPNGSTRSYDIVPGTVSATVTITEDTIFGSGSTIGTFVVTYVASGGGSSSETSSASSGPAPVVQQFGKPATGTCDEAQPEGLNWSGVADGGWGVSWAQWVNGGNGGAVCTRTLIYSTAQSKWVVS